MAKSNVERSSPITELSSTAFGGKVLFATDEWFADSSALLSPTEPVFILDKYTEFGKWMDGWETRRKRIPGHDWCIIRLGLPGVIREVRVDTAFFTGNQAPRFSLQAANLSEDPRELQGIPVGITGTAASAEAIQAAESIGSQRWDEIVPFTALGPGYPESRYHTFKVTSPRRWTHLRLNIFPDGGVARLKVLGEVSVDWTRLPIDHPVDLASATLGAVALGCSNKHYGEPSNLLAPGRGFDMRDGWETARHPDRPPVLRANADGLLEVPGSNWAVIRLGAIGSIHELEVDTIHFRGNAPESCKVEAALVEPRSVSEEKLLEADEHSAAGGRAVWRTLLPRTKLQPHTSVTFRLEDDQLKPIGNISHLRLTMYPDGGIKRLRAVGYRLSTSAKL